MPLTQAGLSRVLELGALCTPRPWLYSFISPSFRASLPDLSIQLRSLTDLVVLITLSHQFPLPACFMAVLVQRDSSDVEKRAGGGISSQQEPGWRICRCGPCGCCPRGCCWTWRRAARVLWGSFHLRFLSWCMSRGSCCGCLAGSISAPTPTAGAKAPAEFHRAEKGTQEQNVMVLLCSFLSDADGFSESYQNRSIPGCFKSSISLFTFCQEAQLFFSMLYLKKCSWAKS